MAEDKLIVGLSADIKDLQRKLTQAQGLLQGYSKGVEDLGKKQDPFKNITSSIKNLVGAYVGLQAAQKLVTNAFNESIQIDSIQSAYSQIFKSSEVATLQLERLRDRADELGLKFLDLATAYKSFAGASVTVGLSLADTNKIFDAVTNAAAQLKLNSEQTQGTLLALSQMISKGTVSMEELRQQLGERLPGAMKLFADGLGVSTQELNKMIESGKVMAQDALPKFADRLNQVYGATAPIKGLQASVNELANTFTDAVRNGAIGKFFMVIVDGAKEAIKFVERSAKGFQILINESKFNSNQIFQSQTSEINKALELGAKDGVKAVSELIKEYTKLGKAYGVATEEGKMYYELVKIASEAQKTLLINTSRAAIDSTKTIKSLQDELKTLTERFVNAEIGSATFKDLAKQIANVQQQLENANNTNISQSIKFQMPSMDEQFMSSDIDLSPLIQAQKEITTFQAQTNMLNGSLKEMNIIGQDATKNITIGLDSMGKEMVTINSLQNELTYLTNKLNETPINSEQWVILQQKILGVTTQLQGLQVQTDANNMSAMNLVNTFGMGLTGAFEQAITGAESFGKAFLKMIAQLIARLIAAIAAAAVLAALVTIATGGTNMIGGSKVGFAQLLGMTSGGMLGGASGTGQRVASPTGAGSLNNGSVEFNIMGDKLYGVLQNYNNRLTRLQ